MSGELTLSTGSDLTVSGGDTSLTGGLTVYTGATTSNTGLRKVQRISSGQYALAITGNAENTGTAYKLTVNDLGKAIKHAFAVQKGWSLLGNSFDVPLAVSDLVANNTSTIVTVWKWDGANSNWQFYTPAMSATELADYAKSKGYTVLTDINPREGFWVNSKEAISTSEFTVVPTAISSEEVKLGWNLLATEGSLDPRQIDLRLSDAPPTPPSDAQATAVRPANFKTMWAWNNANSKWYFYAPSLDQPNATTLSSYISSKSYLDFFDRNSPKKIELGDGFWLNK